MLSLELKILAAMGMWTILLTLPPAMGRIQAGGINWAFGNRDITPETPPWVGRASRAYFNMLENVIPFAIFILVLTVTGKTNAVTDLAATVFFWARIAHGVFYIAGITHVRTLAYCAGLVSNIFLLLEIVR